jgi:GNAT superfamily N-acetyltransferase
MSRQPRVSPSDLLADAVARTRAAARGEQPQPLEAELRNGTLVRLRPIRPRDKEGLRRGLAWLSPRSKQLGFHHPLDHLTDEQLEYVTEIDHRDHVAWVAFDPETAPNPPGIAIGRYVRTSHTPTVAEAAITVLDDYQGKGLGTLLLGILASVAVDNGIDVFRNYVLADNEAVLTLFDQLGASRQTLTHDVYEVDLPLPSDIETLAETAVGRTLRTVATHGSEGSHLALTMPPLWARRRRHRREHAEHPPELSSLRERGPFGDWLDAVFEGDVSEESEPPAAQDDTD